MQRTRYRFGAYQVDIGKRLLTKNGQPCEIQPRSFEILRLLVEHAGNTISKEQLMTEIWKGVHVNENSVDKQISIIRKLLGDGEDSRPYIDTVPREGYRFVAEVIREDPTSRARAKRWIWAAALSSLVSCAAFWAYFGFAKKRSTAGLAEPGLRTVVFIPLKNANNSATSAWISTWPLRFRTSKFNQLAQSYLMEGVECYAATLYKG